MGRAAALLGIRRAAAVFQSRRLQYFSTDSPSASTETLKVQYERGLPLLTVPLPSRHEPCQFLLRPLSDTVSVFCDQLKVEDRGLDLVAVYAKDGNRIASSTSVEHLLRLGSFTLRLNDTYFNVDVHDPTFESAFSSEKVRHLDDIRATVASLHAILCVDEYKLARERKLILRLEEIETELNPLEEQKKEIEQECEAHSRRVMWTGFAAMGLQTGLFARLTWWEYSWDIMEPITYFATYATIITTLGYYLYARQNFDYPTAKERIFTKAFYKRAQRENFDIQRYNQLVKESREIKSQLNRIRDPLFQHMPVSYLSRIEDHFHD